MANKKTTTTTTKGCLNKRVRPTTGQTFYEVLISRGTDKLTGKRLRESKAFETKKEAQSYLNKRLHELDAGIAVDKNRLTVAELLEKWLDEYAQHNVSAVTLDGYRNTIHTHLIPAVGALNVQDLAPTHLSRLYSGKLSKDGCSPRVVVLMHRRLSQALRMAVEQGLVARNVATSVSPPRDRRKEVVTWSKEELQRFLEVAQTSSYGPVWVLSLATGMRKGELLGLRWSDLDWSNETVHVRQTQKVIRGKTSLEMTAKTAAGKRTITVPPTVMNLLKDHRVRQLGRGHYSKTGLVFTSDVGTSISPRNLSRQCDSLMVKAAVPRLTVHQQRHTHITQLLLAGMNVKAVSERAGHSDVSITLGTYSHLTQEARRELADMAENLLFG